MFQKLQNNLENLEPTGLIPARFFALYGVNHTILDLGPILAHKKSNPNLLVLPETTIPFFEVVA